MKFEIEIDEKKILEKVYLEGNSEYGLSKAVEDELKQQSVERFVREIKETSTERYSSNSEYFHTAVTEEILKRIDNALKTLISNALSEKEIKNSVERKVSNLLNEWISNKVTEKLNSVKADLHFYSESELKEEVEAREAEQN